MKRFGLMLLILILIVSIQTSIVSILPIGGVVPDITFVFVICFALVRENVESILVALIVGLLRDSLFPGVFGMNTLIFILTAFLMGLIQKRIYRDNFVIPAFFTFILTSFMGMMYYFFMFTMSYRFSIKEVILDFILLQAVYNSVVSFFMYKFILWLSSISLFKERWKF